VIYDLHHRYLFIHIPRTAGVAITRALAGVSSHCVVDLTAGRHMTAAALKQRLGDRWHQFRPWAIARSPWDIVLSDYRLTLRDLQVGALQARLAPGWRGRLERMRDEPGFEAFVHREICDPRYSRIRGGYWRTWSTDAGTDVGVEPIRYDALEDWDAVADGLGLPACELPRVNQTPDVECPVWTGDAIEAIGRVCGDDVERFEWQRPKITQAAVSLQT